MEQKFYGFYDNFISIGNGKFAIYYYDNTPSWQSTC